MFQRMTAVGSAAMLLMTLLGAAPARAAATYQVLDATAQVTDIFEGDLYQVALSGRLVTVDGDGTTVPVANAPMRATSPLADPCQPSSVDFVTDASGRFTALSGRVCGGRPWTIKASPAGTPVTRQVALTPAQVRVKAFEALPSITATGSLLSLDATVEQRDRGGAWIPMSAPVTIANADGSFVIHTSTGSDGRVSRTSTDAARSADWHIELDGLKDVHGGATATSFYAYPIKASFFAVKARTPKKSGDGLSLTGTLGFGPKNATDLRSSASVRLEHSRDEKSWKQVGGAAIGTGNTFWILEENPTRGYYRVRLPAAGAFAGAVGPSTRVQAQTQVEGRPDVLSKKKGKSTVRVKGRLGWYTGSAYAAFAEQPLTLWFKPAGGKKWTRKKTFRTDAKGKYDFKTVATRTGQWEVRFAGTSWTLPSVGDRVTVAVRG
ncbi:hypothetical protein EDD29_8348 [Actinocorallia herbida]|uniref:Carboxypeptidase regulatory-like domain-containing protein n=1 Tax=Actinocorallia herbida TaxID=58109 RepID=A0A3N1DAX1_9ACTN|nr:hypothetical protein [Actinocorallia herbida]ROO90616.1 hypothetical protein EDD29_8348 [Actinocorallia herbida]